MLEFLIILLVAHEADVAWQNYKKEQASAPQSLEASQSPVEKMDTK